MTLLREQIAHLRSQLQLPECLSPLQVVRYYQFMRKKTRNLLRHTIDDLLTRLPESEQITLRLQNGKTLLMIWRPHETIWKLLERISLYQKRPLKEFCLVYDHERLSSCLTREEWEKEARQEGITPEIKLYHQPIIVRIEVYNQKFPLSLLWIPINSPSALEDRKLKYPEHACDRCLKLGFVEAPIVMDSYPGCHFCPECVQWIPVFRELVELARTPPQPMTSAESRDVISRLFPQLDRVREMITGEETFPM